MEVRLLVWWISIRYQQAISHSWSSAFSPSPSSFDKQLGLSTCFRRASRNISSKLLSFVCWWCFLVLATTNKVLLLDLVLWMSILGYCWKGWRWKEPGWGCRPLQPNEGSSSFFSELVNKTKSHWFQKLSFLEGFLLVQRSIFVFWLCRLLRMHVSYRTQQNSTGLFQQQLWCHSVVQGVIVEPMLNPLWMMKVGKAKKKFWRRNYFYQVA